MNWYKTAQEIVTAYHSSDVNFNKFDLSKTSQNILWFTTDKNKLLSKESGADGHGIIYTVQLTVNKIAGWDEYSRMGIWELKRDGFDSIKLDDDYVIFDPKQIKILNKQRVGK